MKTAIWCENKDIRYLKAILLLLSIFVLFSLIDFSSTATFNIEDESIYNSQNISVNEHVQSIIQNNVSSGDTIKFLGNNYNNLSLVIAKKLNIVSGSKTRLIGSNDIIGITIKGYDASGTNISGLNFINYSTALMLDQTQDITINNGFLKEMSME